MTDRPRWWLIGVAAFMAALFLYQTIGLTGEIVLVVGFAAGSVGYRIYRSRLRARAMPPSNRTYIN
jgi:hypothetical protein